MNTFVVIAVLFILACIFAASVIRYKGDKDNGNE